MTPDEQKKAQTWLQEHVPNRCPSCGGNDRALQPHRFGLYTTQEFGRGLDLVVLLCHTCGFVAPYSAHTLGISREEG